MNTFMAVLLVAAAEQLDCYRSKSMTDVRLCKDAAQQAESKMQDAYEQAMHKLGDDHADEQKAFATAQRQWSDYRKTYCSALSQHWGTGSIHDAYYLACMKEHAERRTSELSGYPGTGPPPATPEPPKDASQPAQEPSQPPAQP